MGWVAATWNRSCNRGCSRRRANDGGCGGSAEFTATSIVLSDAGLKVAGTSDFRHTRSHAAAVGDLARVVRLTTV